ncbi:MAG TPA: hypothetical protein VLH10_14465 [Yinghuangia sp.]|nr:hypothetical protein [Yinghuangia sp.]
MASGKPAKRLPAKGARTAAGLVLAVSGVQVLQAATAADAHADESNRAPEPDRSGGPGRGWAINDWLQRNVPVTPDMVPPDAQLHWSKKFVAWLNQRVILEAQFGVMPSGTPSSWAVLAKDVAYGVTSFLGERGAAGETARTDAIREILEGRSAAIADYVAESRTGTVSPETLQRYVTMEASYQAVPENHRHLEINEFARDLTAWRREVDGSPFRSPQTDPILNARVDAARTAYQAAERNGTLTDAIEYELYKAVLATDPNVSAEKLQSTNFVDWQQAKYSGELPEGRNQGPRGPGTGGDPAGTGPDKPKPVTPGPSGGAADPSRGTAPETGRPSGGQADGGSGAGRGGAPDPSGHADGTTRSEPGRPPAGDGKPVAGAPERAPAGDPATKPAPGAEPKPARAQQETGKTPPATKPEPAPAWDETGKPAEKPKGPPPATPEAPKFTPGSVPDTHNGGVYRSVKVNAAAEAAMFGLEVLQAHLTSDVLNWVVRRAQQDPEFVDRYLVQYEEWQRMSWLERQQYDFTRLWKDGTEFINSAAFFAEMANYMRAMQEFYRANPGITPPGLAPPPGAGDESQGPGIPVAPYTGGAQTTDAANRITRDENGMRHDQSRIYMLADRDKAPAAQAQPPVQPQTGPKPAEPKADKPKTDKPKADKHGDDKPGPGQVGTAQQRVQEQMQEKRDAKKEEKKEDRKSDNKPGYDSHGDSGGSRRGGDGHGSSGGGSTGGGSTGSGTGGSGGGNSTGGGNGPSGGNGSAGAPGADSGDRGGGVKGNFSKTPQSSSTRV